ncbi:uncharacterized protein [Eurosta solidaginis]|uniref:uncharacterized protein isoform X2 n=1 Tax=Eurosta solidaginis TaxID=178769 RepID=UPI0035309DF7
MICALCKKEYESIDGFVRHLKRIYDIHMSLQSSYCLEGEILEIFPNEKLSFYRTEKRGKLYTKFCNMKKSIKSYSSEAKQRRMESPEVEKNVPEIGAEEMLQRVKFNNLTAEEFQNAWQAYANYRINQTKFQNIHQIFREWPEYKESDGYSLIDLDFTVMFPNTHNFLSCQQELLRLFHFLQKPGVLKDSSTKFIINSISEKDLEKVKVVRKTNAGKKRYLQILF